MTMMNYRCRNERCRVILFKASASTARCPACNKEGEFYRKKATS